MKQTHPVRSARGKIAQRHEPSALTVLARILGRTGPLLEERRDDSCKGQMLELLSTTPWPLWRFLP